VKPKGVYTSELNQAALRQYGLNLEMFVDCARNIGAIPILMTQARLVTRANTDEQRKRIRYGFQLLTHEGLCDAFEETDAIIRQVADKKGVRVIDVSEGLTGVDEFFRDHVHLSAQGRERISQLVADELVEFLQ